MASGASRSGAERRSRGSETDRAAPCVGLRQGPVVRCPALTTGRCSSSESDIGRSSLRFVPRRPRNDRTGCAGRSHCTVLTAPCWSDWTMRIRWEAGEGAARGDAVRAAMGTGCGRESPMSAGTRPMIDRHAGIRPYRLAGSGRDPGRNRWTAIQLRWVSPYRTAVPGSSSLWRTAGLPSDRRKRQPSPIAARCGAQVPRLGSPQSLAR